MIVVVGDSALQILAMDGLTSQLDPIEQGSSFPWARGYARDLKELEEYGISCSRQRPLHILVDGKASRIQSDRVINHICSGGLPAGALCHLAPGVVVASPEFCYLQAGQEGIERAAAVGMELCGAYGRIDGARGFTDRQPISTLDRLQRFIAGAKGFNGIKAARQALDYVLEGSRSPLETKAALLLTFPTSLGGYGLPKPTCNHVIVPQGSERAVFQEPYYVADLCWENERVTVECDSYAYHASREQLDHDARKRNSLTAAGWSCISATSAQLEGFDLDVLARQLCQLLKIPFNQPEAALRDRLIARLP